VLDSHIRFNYGAEVRMKLPKSKGLWSISEAIEKLFGRAFILTIVVSLGKASASGERGQLTLL